jgi:hypothetical protein
MHGPPTSSYSPRQLQRCEPFTKRVSLTDHRTAPTRTNHYAYTLAGALSRFEAVVNVIDADANVFELIFDSLE